MSFAEAFGGRTRIRLLAMVISLFLVFKLIDVVRQPQAWHWFFAMSGIPVKNEAAENIPNPKLKPTAPNILPEGTFIAQGQKPIISEQHVSHEATAASKAGEQQPVEVNPGDPLPRVWKEAWHDIYKQLQYHERSVMYRALKAGRDGQPLEVTYADKLKEILPKLDHAWSDYRAEAAAALVTVPDEEKPLWLDLLARAGARWVEHLQPALQKIADDMPLSDEDKQEIFAFQDVLDANLLREVEDDTIWRASETEISFRLFERVKQAAHDEKKPKAKPASYLQLYKQSADYRGEWVHFKGVARQVYHVEAQSNWVGINGYYVFVVKPHDVNSPVFVYALELPPGFPKVWDKDIDKKTNELNDEIEFTGLYLKRYAYLGKDGTYTAPLILANNATGWKAPPKAFGGFGLTAYIWRWELISGTLTTLVLIAVVIWYFRPRPVRIVALPDEVGKELENFQPLSVTEQLKQLEQQQAAAPQHPEV